MDITYTLTPFCAWLLAGSCKFAINSFKTGTLAFALIGYGGLPSNHSAIVCSTAALIALREGLNHPAFGVAVTVAFIVMLDATSLRRQVGRQAAAINHLQQHCATPQPLLRERMGHSGLEIVSGVVVGIITGWLVHVLSC